MADAKTIDNLGPEVHKRYMDALKLLDEKDVEKVFKTPAIAGRIETLTVSPSYSMVEELFNTRENKSSPFVPPPKFFLTSSNIFTSSIIPALDENDKIAMLKNASNLPKTEEDERKEL